MVRAERGVLIAETRSGWICANAGIDASNVPGDERVTLLPEDADASARRIRAEIARRVGVAPGGRDRRQLRPPLAARPGGRRDRLRRAAPLDDWRGRADREGRELAATAIAIADQVAAAADLARQGRRRSRRAWSRGLGRFVTADDGPGAPALQRARGRRPLPLAELAGRRAVCSGSGSGSPSSVYSGGS